MLGRPGRQRRPRRDPPAPARQPGAWTGSRRRLRFHARSATTSRASSTSAIRNRSHRSHHHRPARGQPAQGAGCDVGAVEVGWCRLSAAAAAADVGPPTSASRRDLDSSDQTRAPSPARRHQPRPADERSRRTRVGRRSEAVAARQAGGKRRLQRRQDRDDGADREALPHSMTASRGVPVSEYGDRDHRFGFHYDERDGTGLDRRPALAIDTRSTYPDYIFLKFDHRDECQSAPTKPGTPEDPGTADPAAKSRHGGPRPPTCRRPLASFEDACPRAETEGARPARAGRLEDMSERFDELESCLSWVPVTEYGDPDGRFGYLFGGEGAVPATGPRITIDVSEWDDPDYMFLGFRRGDLPSSRSIRRRGGDETPGPPAPTGPSGRECGGEPGESVDRAPRRHPPAR